MTDFGALRSTTCQLVADALAETGRRLWHASHLLHDQHMEAMALVTQMAGELGQGATAMFGVQRWYAGSALVRQLFETQYLLARFAADDPAAKAWLAATQNQLDNQFRPGQMRQAGGFSASEYRTHCSWGGHPNPGARWLLADHQRLVAVELLWADLAQHLTDTWRIVLGALQALGPDEDLLPPNAAQVSEYSWSWVDTDPHSRRVKLPRG